jgi:hypothetical protein
MTLVSSANDIGSEGEFILRGRLLMYVQNNKGPRIEPWGTPRFTIPKPQEEM